MICDRTGCDRKATRLYVRLNGRLHYRCARHWLTGCAPSKRSPLIKFEVPRCIVPGCGRLTALYWDIDYPPGDESAPALCNCHATGHEISAR